jgi:transposase
MAQRKKRLTMNQLWLLALKLAAKKGSVEKVAAYFGMAASTIYRWKGRNIYASYLYETYVIDGCKKNGIEI